MTTYTDALLQLAQAQAKAAATSPRVVEYDGRPCGPMRDAWATLCRRAGLEDLHIHDLRRSFATLAARAGAELDHVADFLNLDAKTLRRHYAHGAPDRLLAQIKQIEGE
jgi:integrase